MARSVFYVRYNNREVAEEKATKILTDAGFHMAEQDDNTIWVKGDVKTTGVKGVQIDYEEKQMKISGWIQGIIGGEVQLEGFASMIPKRTVKKVIDQLVKEISE
mgnify:CR=1 FL=1